MSSRFGKWFNNLTGLGGNRDSITNTTLLNPTYLTRQDTFNPFIQSHIIRKVCEYAPTNSWVKGGTLTLGEGDNLIIHTINEIILGNNRVGLVADGQPRLEVARFFEEAQTEARRTGGCAIVMDIEDGKEQQEPVDIDNIQYISKLRFFNRYEIRPFWELEYYTGALEPIYYHILSSGGEFTGKIHKSRVLPFYGARLPREDNYALNDGWAGDSLIRQIFEQVARLESSSASVANRLSRFVTVVLKIRGMIDNLASDVGTKSDEPSYAKKIATRLTSIIEQQSVFGGIGCDLDEEDINYLEHKFQDVEKLLRFYRDEVVSATGMPEFIIYGKHGSGLGQVEMGERASIAALIEQEQAKVKGNLTTLITYLFLSKKGITNGKIPDDWGWRFNPLWQPSEDEIAITQKNQSETLQTFVDMGEKLGTPILTAKEIRNSVFSGSDFGGTDIQLDESDYNLVIKEKEEMRKAILNQPSPLEQEATEDDDDKEKTRTIPVIDEYNEILEAVKEYYVAQS